MNKKTKIIIIISICIFIGVGGNIINNISNDINSKKSHIKSNVKSVSTCKPTIEPTIKQTMANKALNNIKSYNNKELWIVIESLNDIGKNEQIDIKKFKLSKKYYYYIYQFEDKSKIQLVTKMNKEHMLIFVSFGTKVLK